MPLPDSLREKTYEMAKSALNMWKLTHQAFMEHRLEFSPIVLEEENKINQLEKEIATELVNAGKEQSAKKTGQRLAVYVDIAGDLELIGDYCKDILERVQIKIEEKLFFSDDAVKEYNELYRQTTAALEMVVSALKTCEKDGIKVVLKEGRHIDDLVDEYRRNHNQRLADGVCSPFACNMFLNMLDFTAAVYSHAQKIAKSLARI